MGYLIIKDVDGRILEAYGQVPRELVEDVQKHVFIDEKNNREQFWPDSFGTVDFDQPYNKTKYIKE